MIEGSMTQTRNPRLLILAVLILGLVAADVVRRSLPSHADRAPPVTVADTTTLGGGSQPADDTAAAAERRRARTRERIDADSASGYLLETIRAADSTVRRWPDDRFAVPLRVAITRQPVDGFREEFAANVAWAVSRWDGLVPVHFDTGADSATADVVVVWTPQLDSN